MVLVVLAAASAAPLAMAVLGAVVLAAALPVAVASGVALPVVDAFKATTAILRQTVSLDFDLTVRRINPS